MQLQPYAIAAIAVLVLFEMQSYVRFGAKARKLRAGASDRGSTVALSLASLVPAVGFVIGQRISGPHRHIVVPDWIVSPGPTPFMVGLAWAGVAFALAGLCLRLWAVLTLRHRYTRTLLINDSHLIERGGPYRCLRHPGYLGSLLCLNGFALASTSVFVVIASLAATIAAYAYRIRVEDRMLVAHFGKAHEDYRREVPAVLPFL
jgi:protein-S-isoprenylcysteine O-methyltransferase Ste14